MRSAVLLLALGLGAVANAQETGDDFEDGGFNAQFWSAEVGVTVTPAAAHRGSYGLQLALGVGSPAAFARAALTDGDGGRAALRFWLQAGGGGGGLFPIGDIYAFAVPTNDVIAEVVAGYDGGVPFVEVGWTEGGIPQRSGNLTYLDTRWHLIELSVYGIGSPSGQAGLWMDGTQIDVGFAEDLSSHTLTQVTVGPAVIYTAPATTDVFYFDDVRETNFGLPGSTLAIQGPPNAMANSCAPYPVALLTSTGSPASAPYPFNAHLGDALTVSSWYAEMTCNQAAPVAFFAAGASSVATYLDDPVGTFEPTASATDFLGAEVTVNFWQTLPDAGARPDGGVPPDGGVDAGRSGGDGGPSDGGADSGAPSAPELRAALGCSAQPDVELAAWAVVWVSGLGFSNSRPGRGSRVRSNPHARATHAK